VLAVGFLGIVLSRYTGLGGSTRFLETCFRERTFGLSRIRDKMVRTSVGNISSFPVASFYVSMLFLISLP